MVTLLLIFCLKFVFISGFNAPGIIPPESFIAERWYPSNLPTVMPPWKMPGIDISNFRTARPHHFPGIVSTTTTPSAPTNSLPMPPGTAVPVMPEIPINGPHPPAPPQIEASGGLASSESAEEGSSLPISSTNISSSEEVMSVATTPSRIEKDGIGVIMILSPVFEDITKMDNSSDSVELLHDGAHADKNDSLIEGSGTDSVELNSLLDSTLATTLATNTKDDTETSMAPKITTTMASESSTLSTTESSSLSTETISSSSKLLTTTMKSLQSNQTKSVHDVQKPVKTKSRPTADCKDIIFLLDSSGNVVQQYEKQKKYIEEIVNQLEESHSRRMALITYAGKTRQKIVVPLSDEPNATTFVAKLRKARFLRGVTATGAAISVTTQYVLQKNRNAQVVVVTDGFSFDDVDHQSEALRAVIGNQTFVTGRYFPIVRNVLLAIGGTDNKVFFDKKEKRLIDELQC